MGLYSLDKEKTKQSIFEESFLSLSDVPKDYPSRVVGAEEKIYNDWVMQLIKKQSHREVVKMRIAGLTYKQIARFTGVSFQRIWQIYNQAVEEIKTKVKDQDLHDIKKKAKTAREYSREYSQSSVGRLSQKLQYIRKTTGLEIYVRDLGDEKESLASFLDMERTLKKTETEMLKAQNKRRCPLCGRVLGYDMFCIKGVSGPVGYCRDCEREYQLEYRQKNAKKQKKVLDKTESIPDNG